MKMMSVVGARPNFMKVAPIIKAIRSHNDHARRAGEDSETIQHLLVHTGQHYDKLMSDSFFADLELPPPDVHLGVGSGSHAEQTAEVMRKFEKVLLEEKPDVLIVVGDVNSTLACALVASKARYDSADHGALIAHVEAGLRSGDRTMPEEINRILTDQLSHFLFVTEESAIGNLAIEGIAAEKVHFVGNTMIDSLLGYKHRADASTILHDLGFAVEGSAPSPYALLTLHRPANVDQRETFLEILDGLDELAASCPIIFPAHPRTQKRIVELGLEDYFETDSPTPSGQMPRSATGRIRMIGPLGYLDFVHLMGNAQIVVTDSGGIQEETTCLGVPCVTARENTERPITISKGTNVLAGVRSDGIRKAIAVQRKSLRPSTMPEKWDGKSAARIVAILGQAVRDREDVPVMTHAG